MLRDLPIAPFTEFGLGLKLTLSVVFSSSLLNVRYYASSACLSVVFVYPSVYFVNILSVPVSVCEPIGLSGLQITCICSVTVRTVLVVTCICLCRVSAYFLAMFLTGKISIQMSGVYLTVCLS